MIWTLLIVLVASLGFAFALIFAYRLGIESERHDWVARLKTLTQTYDKESLERSLVLERMAKLLDRALMPEDNWTSRN